MLMFEPLEICSSFSQVLGLDPRVGGGWDVHTGLGTVTTNRCSCEPIVDKECYLCDIRVINACGFWGREVGKLAGLDLPLVPVQHQVLLEVFLN